MLQKIENGRANLLSRGKKALLQKGYGGVVIAELTAQCGMATGTFYNYFRSKDALIDQIVSDDWAALLKKIRRRMERSDDARANLEFLYAHLADFQRRYTFFAAGSAVRRGPVIHSEQENLQALYDIMADKFRRAGAAGALVFGMSPENAAYMIVQTCMVAGRNPAMDFGDLWAFLHMTGRTPAE
ncbi:MAG: TetR/AcrR family transcriptional regulator [Oscillospiraceae bacterium]|nr:TetR/AcrR family transcriptional regulator [Oscillospiraceae bacterium]